MDKQQIKTLREAANTGMWFEARIHTAFTELADMMYGDGYLTREERKALSGGIGKALEAFTAAVEADAPQLYKRGRWQDPEATGDMPVSESEKGLLAKITEFLRGLAGEKPINEAEVSTEFTPLIESAVREDGTMAIRIIQPGWGSSGYYPADILERDGPKVFKAGTKIYIDHPTPTEEAERPERSVKDLAAEMITDARWQPEHPKGPGLYAEAKVLDHYRPLVNELAPHIGMSIRATGKAQYGQAEGKTGPVIQEITSARSVDLVTQPGAGGQILSLFEARREAAHNTTQPKESTMSDADLKALQEANAQLTKTLQEQAAQMARFQEQALLREAGEYVALELAETAKDLPAITRNRLLRDLAKSPVIKDGHLDQEAYKAQIAEAVKTEREYVATLTEAGKITGMGGTTPPANDEASRKALVEAFKRAGFDDKTAEIAAAGR